jgi:hypothetical protein
MTDLEQRLSAALAEMSAGLRPRPDPYARVRVRLRRDRIRRAVAGAAAVVALAAGAVAVLERPAPPAPQPSDRERRPVERWRERLFDSRPRGALAADQAFRSALDDATGARVLFADDVDHWRVALVAGPEPYWLVADRGVPPEVLAAAEPVRPEPGSPLPVWTASAPGASAAVAVAPEGCAIEAADWPAVDRWSPVPTGSYVTRTLGEPARWWRAVCDGRVREVTYPAGFPPGTAIVGDDDAYDAAVAQALGTPDREQVRGAVVAAVDAWGYGVAAAPKVVWGGVLDPGDPAAVVTAPAVHGGVWLGLVSVRGEVAPFTTFTEPGDPGVVLAVRLRPDGDRHLVLAPPGAVTARVVAGGREVARVPFRDGAAVVTAPVTDDLKVEALDGIGAAVASGGLARYGADVPGRLADWG